MKKNLILIALSSVIVLTACKKEKDTPDQTPVAVKATDSISALVNGKPWPGNYKWKAEAVGDSSGNKFGLGVTVYSNNSGMILQTWSINGLNVSVLEKNTYSYLKYPHEVDTSYTLFTLDEGDGIYNRYAVWENAPVANRIFIDSFDASSKRIKGHFNLSMYRSDDDNRAALYGFADTLRFTDGYFDVQIKSK